MSAAKVEPLPVKNRCISNQMPPARWVLLACGLVVVVVVVVAVVSNRSNLLLDECCSPEDGMGLDWMERREHNEGMWVGGWEWDRVGLDGV